MAFRTILRISPIFPDSPIFPIFGFFFEFFEKFSEKNFSSHARGEGHAPPA